MRGLNYNKFNALINSIFQLYYNTVIITVEVVMVKKLTPIGSSVGLILDKALLELYHFDENVEITPTFEGLLIRPTKNHVSERKARIGKALDKANSKYGRALKNLAK